MNLYEKTLAQLERKYEKFKYVLTRIPITDEAKFEFGVYELNSRESNNNNAHILKDALERNKRKNNSEFEYVFYYDDSNETEEEREKIALISALDSWNRNSHSLRKLIFDVDYRVMIKKVPLNS